VVGSPPALNASNADPPHVLSKPSAIWERALLWTHRKSTLGTARE
jgi:hypothetical protein